MGPYKNKNKQTKHMIYKIPKKLKEINFDNNLKMEFSKKRKKEFEDKSLITMTEFIIERKK
jgi:hypothetical protein